MNICPQINEKRTWVDWFSDLWCFGGRSTKTWFFDNSPVAQKIRNIGPRSGQKPIFHHGGSPERVLLADRGPGAASRATSKEKRREKKKGKEARKEGDRGLGLVGKWESGKFKGWRKAPSRRETLCEQAWPSLFFGYLSFQPGRGDQHAPPPNVRVFEWFYVFSCLYVFLRCFTFVTCFYVFSRVFTCF